MKRSQITLVFLVVVVLIFLIVLVPFLRNTIEERSTTEPADVALFIETSLMAAAAHCLNEIGLRGGQREPAEFVATAYGNVGSAFSGEPVPDSETIMQRELERCVEETMLLCVDGFEAFEQLGVKITSKKPRAAAQLSASHTSVVLQFPVTIEATENQLEISQYLTKHPVRLATIHRYMNQLAHERGSHTNRSDFDLSYLGSLDANTNIYQHGDSHIYEFRVLKSQLGGQPYVFLSAHPYGD